MKKIDEAFMGIYTDGGCTFNPGNLGSISFMVIGFYNNSSYILSFFSSVILKNETNITNNKMELLAAINGMSQGLNLYNSSFKKVVLFTDSKYVELGINNKFRKSQNIDLWKQILLLKTEFIKRKIDFNVVWIKGHAGNLFNRFVDKFLNDARNVFKHMALRNKHPHN